MSRDYRSGSRSVGATFRMTEEERDQLREVAAREGYSSLQQLFEARLLGEAKPKRKPGPQPQAERLDLTA